MADYPKPITYLELRKRAAAGDLNAAELAAYFQPDTLRSKAFVPAAKLNDELVDTQGARPTSKTITKLLMKAEAAARIKAQPAPPPRRAARSRAAPRVSVLAEGDSWFNLPDLFVLGYPDDAVDVLKRTHNVKPVAFWGDEIAKMVNETNKKNYLVPLNSGLWRHFIFSGGGNDVLAGIGKYVKRLGSPGTSPNNAASYIDPNFDAKLTETLGHYNTLYGHVRSSQEPDTPLYVHGYAYVIPRANGPYVGKALQQLGFDPASELAKAIVRELVNRFNVRLKAFADARATVHYVDLRSELVAGDWHTDEIHPNGNGAAKVARRLREAIAAQIPTV